MGQTLIKQKKLLIEMFDAGYISSKDELKSLLKKSDKTEINNYIKNKLKIYWRG